MSLLLYLVGQLILSLAAEVGTLPALLAVIGCIAWAACGLVLTTAEFVARSEKARRP